MRTLIVVYFVVAISILILVRVFTLSVSSHEYYEKLSNDNYLKKEYKAPPRGAILDRNGEFLAINKIGFQIAAKPHLTTKAKQKELTKILTLIAHYFPEYSIEELQKKYLKQDSRYRHEDIILVDHIPYDDFFAYFSILNANPHISIQISSKRFYPFGDIGAHFIGYTGKINPKEIEKNPLLQHYKTTGKSGLEKYYNHTLQGKLGIKSYKVNATAKVMGILSETAPEAFDIQTTVDIKLQEHIHTLFKDISGAVIVMDIHTGEILAAGSFPEFDNNLFVNGISHSDWERIINDFDHPFTNKLINGKYPPGSIIKMGVAVSFLENGIAPETEVYCTSSLPLGNRVFRCWKQEGHGTTGFIKAIRESCDDFFYKQSLKVGIDTIEKTLSRFGVGKITGVDQPNESAGINPNKLWKEKTLKTPWYQGETVVSSIGQGFLSVTPMQMARYTASLATGKLVLPHFLKNKKLEKSIDLAINPSHFKIIKQGMFEVANHPMGTATSALKSSKVTLAGKTGTAQVIGIPQSEVKRMQEHELEYYHRSHAWLTTYGPYEDPKYSVTVLVEHGGHGGSAGGAITASIYNKLLELGYISTTAN